MEAAPLSKLFNAIGVCVHANWVKEPEWNPAADDPHLYVKSVLDLGVPHIRTALGQSKDVRTSLQPFFDAGGQICANVFPSGAWSGAKSMVDYIGANYPISAISGFEGPNEYNHDHSFDECKADLPPAMKAMHDYVRANPKYASVKLVGPSPFTRQMGFYQAVANLYGIDVVNLHNYNEGRRPTVSGGDTKPATLDQVVKDCLIVGPGKPIWATETGYKEGADDAKPAIGQLTELAAAKYLLRYPFDYLARGVERMYIYSLRDDPARGAINHGLEASAAFNFRRRKAYYAVKNLMAVIRDKGGSPGTLQLGVTCANAALRKYLFRKSDGSFLLALYLDVDSFNRSTFKDIVVPPANVAIALPVSVSSVTLHLPTTGAAPKALGSAAAFSVPVTDELTLLHIVP